jgi:AhpD family alkylhydroperoxidase
MQARLDAQKVSPAAYQALLGMEMFVRKQSKLEPALIELVKIRASQINRCGFCIDMHTKDARAEGETEQRIYALSFGMGRDAVLYRSRAQCSGVGRSDHFSTGRACPR